LIALCLDDLVLRDEWSSLPIVGMRRLEAERDVEVLDLLEQLRLGGTIFLSGSTVQTFPTLTEDSCTRP
jgi:hypothetical protein